MIMRLGGEFFVAYWDEVKSLRRGGKGGLLEVPPGRAVEIMCRR